MEVTEKSESSYYSLSYWDRLPSYSLCCSYNCSYIANSLINTLQVTTNLWGVIIYHFSAAVYTLQSFHDTINHPIKMEQSNLAQRAKIKQEHSESADFRHGSSIRITPNIFFMVPDSDPDHSKI